MMRYIAGNGILPITVLAPLSLIFVLVWLMNVPSASAQSAPHIIEGKVVLDGRPAPDGTLIRPFIDGIRTGRSARTVAGKFRMEVRQGRSASGKTVQFRGTTVDNRELRFSQTFQWQQGGQTTIDLELRGTSSFPVAEVEESHIFQGTIILNGQPVPDETRVSALINQVSVGGTSTKAGRFQLTIRQPVSNAGKNVEIWVRGADRMSLRVPKTWPWQPGGFTEVPVQFGGGAPGDAASRIADERERIERERVLQEEQAQLNAERMKLEQERLKREQSLQVEQDRLDRDRLKGELERQQEQARLDTERRRQDQERIKAEQEIQLQQQRLDQLRAIEEQRRQEELEKARFESERASIDRERALEENRARLDQERLKREQERLRQEVEFNLNQQRLEQEGSRVQLEGGQPPPGDEPIGKGSTRGFFTNSQIGQIGSVNKSLDPATMAVIGIMITLAATTLQMLRGN